MRWAFCLPPLKSQPANIYSRPTLLAVLHLCCNLLAGVLVLDRAQCCILYHVFCLKATAPICRESWALAHQHWTMCCRERGERPCSAPTTTSWCSSLLQQASSALLAALPLLVSLREQVLHQLTLPVRSRMRPHKYLASACYVFKAGAVGKRCQAIHVTPRIPCRPPQSSSKHGPSAQKGRDKKDVRGMMPIIIVPAAATANINMANAKVCGSSLLDNFWASRLVQMDRQACTSTICIICSKDLHSF